MRNKEVSIIWIGETAREQSEKVIRGGYVSMEGDTFYGIQNYDAMEPFFMSIVSSSNHWLFISSSGGLSAGRESTEQSLFPYYTVDKLTENNENTGNKAICLVTACPSDKSVGAVFRTAAGQLPDRTEYL